MSFAITYSARDFAGSALPFPVEFPVHAAADVWAAIRATGEEEFTTLSRSQFEVHTTEPEPGVFQYTVSTNIDYPPSTTVRIFRLVDLTQPFEFPEGGRLPVREVERAFDRVVMQIQRVRMEAGMEGSTVVLPGEAAAIKGIAVFANATVRQATNPLYAGQPGVQLSDNSLWVGTATNSPAWTAILQTPVPDDRLTLAFVADAGLPGGLQTELAARLVSMDPDWVVFGGDNSYSGEAGFDADWAAFDSWVAAQRALPVLGNHDIDGPTTWTKHTNKFAYLPGNRRYYNKVLGGGLVEVFVLHSGRNSAWAEVEPSTEGSAQHAWFTAALRASTARWKLVFFHHPIVSTESDTNTVLDDMDWPEFAAVDGLFCGHAHLAEWLTVRGTPLVNCSGAVRTDGVCSLAIHGAAAPHSQLVWANDFRTTAARLHITPASCVVEFIDVQSGRVLYQRDLADKTLTPSTWGREVVPPEEPVATGLHFVGLVPAAMVVHEWFIECAATGEAPLTGTIYVDDAPACSFSLGAGSYWALTVSDVPAMRIGASVQVVIHSNAGYVPFSGLAVTARGRIVQ